MPDLHFFTQFSLRGSFRSGTSRLLGEDLQVLQVVDEDVRGHPDLRVRLRLGSPSAGPATVSYYLGGAVEP